MAGGSGAAGRALRRAAVPRRGLSGFPLRGGTFVDASVGHAARWAFEPVPGTVPELAGCRAH